MGYILNQYNKPRSTSATSTLSAANLTFMTPILYADARRKQNASDSGVSGDSLNPFSDECVQMQTPLTAGRNYYFHGKIKRLDNEQKFYIKLINYADTSSSSAEAKEQYIKTIIIQGGDTNEWVDVEFIFTPLIQFDTIIFELQRTIADYREETRFPTIVYEELSIVNNMITSQIADGANLLKIGVQSHPGLMMCVNGEEIHIGKTGIVERRNGVITVTSISGVSAAEENPSALNGINIKTFLATLANAIPTDKNITSTCIFSRPKVRMIDPFTLDYMYKEE